MEDKLNNHVPIFSRTVQKSEKWISEMHSQLSWVHSDRVYHLLRGVLHVLRDQLSVNEAAHLAAQLPLILKGTFFENWDPNAKSKSFSKEEFLDEVLKRMGPNWEPNYDLEHGVAVALQVIMRNISRGEMTDVIGSFKPSLRLFFEQIESGVLK